MNEHAKVMHDLPPLPGMNPPLSATLGAPRVFVRWASNSREPDGGRCKVTPNSGASSSTAASAPPHKPKLPWRIFHKHEIRPLHRICVRYEFDTLDWTQPEDEPSHMSPENAFRWVLNTIMKAQLQKGFPVQFMSSGNSLLPLIKYSDVVVLAPMSSEADLKVGGLVFCEVQPGNLFYCHEIHRINYEAPAVKYTISNNKGMESGRCNIEHIYGRVIEVLDVMLPFRDTPITWQVR